MSVEMISLNYKEQEEAGVLNPGFKQDEKPESNGRNLEKIKAHIVEETPLDDDDDDDLTGYQRCILSVQNSAYRKYRRHRRNIWQIINVLLLLAYLGYVGYAVHYRFGDEGSWRLLLFTIFGVILLVGMKIYKRYQENIDNWWQSRKSGRTSKSTKRFGIFMKWFLRIAVFILIVTYVILYVAIDRPENLICVAGLVLFLFILFVTSMNPAKVNWHTVYWGVALQYLFAMMILRTHWGYNIFKWLGDRITEFLENVIAGAVFIFGNAYTDHIFAMKVLPSVVYFFSCVSILYYLGVVQAIVKVLGRFLAFCMGTTAPESINAAANIFVSMDSSCVIIRPYLADMTNSELHALLTNGFATIGGTVLGAYISFGVQANHLLSASVMSAPAALAIAKLSYPDTRRHKNTDFSKMETIQEFNLIDALSNGALSSVKIVGAIAANLIAFIAILSFVNTTLTWFGDRAGIENLTFELICSYAFYPIAFFMGVDVADCRHVAELIGVKTFTNEFVAYSKLQVFIDNKKALDNYTTFFNTSEWYWNKGNVVLNITGQVLEKGIISEKSEVISTYALCGFANLAAIGNMLGVLTVLVPTRRKDLVKIVFRAMVCGNIACFLTGCIAGLLYTPF